MGPTFDLSLSFLLQALSLDALLNSHRRIVSEADQFSSVHSELNLEFFFFLRIFLGEPCRSFKAKIHRLQLRELLARHHHHLRHSRLCSLVTLGHLLDQKTRSFAKQAGQ